MSARPTCSENKKHAWVSSCKQPEKLQYIFGCKTCLIFGSLLPCPAVLYAVPPGLSSFYISSAGNVRSGSRSGMFCSNAKHEHCFVRRLNTSEPPLKSATLGA
ncbi:hypothetical protein C8R46DRAFT_1040902 [Mycena filopes]|nr:hypothetical protein C8R46DRAFT_1040902 [Mycena filopes]